MLNTAVTVQVFTPIGEEPWRHGRTGGAAGERLFARVMAGELSANAAAIEAGFRKRAPALDRIAAGLRA